MKNGRFNIRGISTPNLMITLRKRWSVTGPGTEMILIKKTKVAVSKVDEAGITTNTKKSRRTQRADNK